MSKKAYKKPSASPRGADRTGELRKGIARHLGEPLLALMALAVVVTCAQLKSRPQQHAQHGLDVGPPPAAASSSTPAISSRIEVAGAATSDQTVDTSPAAGSGGALSRFSRALLSLMKKEGEQSLRVLWFGDSHTAADYFPNAVRKRLSQKVPLGGPGYVSLGVPGYRHGMVKVWSDGNLEVSPHPPARRSREDDGIFGLGGTRVTLRDTSAFITAKPVGVAASTPMNFELTYRLPEPTDSLRVAIGDHRFEINGKSASPLASGLRQQRFVATSDATLEIRATHGRPQLFGVLMETQLPGLVIDTLGVNGARFGTVLSWQEESLALLVEQRQPALLIVAYGTNEVFDPEPIERHAQKLQLVVERLRRGAPEADCLVVGPTDATKGGETTRARAAAMDAAERATAERLSCAYFSPYELMASEGGCEAWARQEPPLSLSDGIHLSARGYSRLGEALAGLLLAQSAQD